MILSAIGSEADYLVTSDTADFAHVLRDSRIRGKSPHTQDVPFGNGRCGVNSPAELCRQCPHNLLAVSEDRRQEAIEERPASA